MITFEARALKPFKRRTDMFVVCSLQKKQKMAEIFQEIDQQTGGTISTILREKNWTGKARDIVSCFGTTKARAKRFILAGLGERKDFKAEVIRNIAGTISRIAKEAKCKSITWQIDEELISLIKPTLLAQAILEGFLMGGYAFKKYKSKDEKISESIEPAALTLLCSKPSINKLLNQGLEKGSIVGQAVNMARDLANTPGNKLTPKIFVDFTKDLFKDNQEIKIKVIDQKKAQELGMNAFLGVAQGSVNEPYILEIKYCANKDKKVIALVGKGVTFDAGGISLKPAAGMADMKADMSGAAAVLATLYAISELKPAKNITGYIPLVENLPSATAQRPGDIVKALNGKTIEILNTDAEGRLILADTIAYAAEQKAAEIIDIATLTGACSIALGDAAAAILGTSPKMLNIFKKNTEFTGEKLWQLPLYDEYLEYLKSDIADLANISKKKMAGTASAAKFLEQFTAEIPWVHIDIASTMSYTATSGYKVKGMSGSNTRNLIEYVMS